MILFRDPIFQAQVLEVRALYPLAQSDELGPVGEGWNGRSFVEAGSIWKECSVVAGRRRRGVLEQGDCWFENANGLAASYFWSDMTDGCSWNWVYPGCHW